MRTLVFAAISLAFLCGCDTGERLNRLEKENAELKAALEQRNAATELELQEKCSKSAKAWFRENYSPDKDTTLLDETNHYNRKMNKCFVVVEYHYTAGSGPTWYNDITMWDVYENLKYATFSEGHIIYPAASKLEP